MDEIAMLEQRELPLPFPELAGDLPLLPARMVNEYQYCPRLAYLEWVQGEWSDSADTVEGRYAHRRVDRPRGDLPPADEIGEGERIHARSITLSSKRLGLIAKMDLIEGEGNRVTPVDYKRGKRPHVAHGAYEPERVQLCVQGLILEEHGYVCEEGILYFTESRERVRVAFDEALRELTRNAIDGLRLIAAGGRIPPPLEDSPKCPRCSLVGICLPDEVNHLLKSDLSPRPIAVPREEALPLYVQARGAKVSKKGETLEIETDEESKTVRLKDVSQLVVMGQVYITTPTLHELMSREIPISWYSFGGWFVGHSIGTGHKNVEIRTAHVSRQLRPRYVFTARKGLRSRQDSKSADLAASKLEVGPDAGRYAERISARYSSCSACLCSSPIAGCRRASGSEVFPGVQFHAEPHRWRNALLRFREAQSTTSGRSSERTAILRVCIIDPRMDSCADRSWVRCLPRVLPPAAVRPARVGVGSDGTVSSAYCRL